MAKTKGTKEWADSNVNCYFGCSNNCLYCYAASMAFRFNRIVDIDDWKMMRLNEKAVNKQYKKREGRIMFPTSHDITLDREVEENCMKVLDKLLNAGNSVLITTKPRFRVVRRICWRYRDIKEQIQFRFTITSSNDKTLKFFEPDAPDYLERLQCLEYAFHTGFKTSVSIEPYLDLDLTSLINDVQPHISESVWIGVMSQCNKVIAKLWWRAQFYDKIRINEEERFNILHFGILIGELYDIESVKKIVENLKVLPEDVRKKIRLKDSIVNLLNLENNRIEV